MMSEQQSVQGSGQKPVAIRSCKYDGRVHREWGARLVERQGSLLVFDATFEEEIRHPLLGVIRPGTLSTEFYWTDRWYNVFRFAEPTGELRNFYCNVNTPPSFDGQLLTYVDLDIDVLVARDLSFRVLDEDEFETNAARYAYPQEIRARAREALDEIIALIQRRRFPFDAPQP